MWDSSVKAPQAQSSSVFLIGGFGLASLAFCIAAELGKVRSFQLQTASTGELTCTYPPSASLWYAIAGAICLVVAQSLGFLCGSFTWCPNVRLAGVPSTSRTSVAVVLVAQLCFSATATATLLTAGLQNASLPLMPLMSATEQPHCVLLDDGIFLTAGVLSLFAAILIEAYYIMSMRVVNEVWTDAYSAGTLEGLEMFSGDMSAVRVARSPGEMKL